VIENQSCEKFTKREEKSLVRHYPYLKLRLQKKTKETKVKINQKEFCALIL